MHRGQAVRSLALVLALAAVVCGCTPTSASPDASAAAAACANMARLGCPLGSAPTCANRLQLASTTENATTPAAVLCAGTAPTKPALAVCSPYFACP